jgi:thioredoxin 1
MPNIADLSAASFDNDVLRSQLPVLVDFWAGWCGPCRAVSPIVEEIATSYEGKLKVLKPNVDQNSQTAARYSIRGIPALLFFKDGEVAGQIVGYALKATIDQSVVSVLA